MTDYAAANIVERGQRRKISGDGERQGRNQVALLFVPESFWQKM